MPQSQAAANPDTKTKRKKDRKKIVHYKQTAKNLRFRYALLQKFLLILNDGDKHLEFRKAFRSLCYQ